MIMKFQPRIPIASHGLHEHKYNFPYLNTLNFMDVCPVYMKPLRKGESDHPRGTMFSRLNAVTNPAFATGRYNFKGFFVPTKYVYSPWYAFDQQTEFTFSDSSRSIPASAPFTNLSNLAASFVNTASSTNPREKLCTQMTTPPTDAQPTDPYDIIYWNGTNYIGYNVTAAGSRVLKVLGALGYSLPWDEDTGENKNIISILSYIRLFLDYYFPNQYVGSSMYDTLNVIWRESNDYSNITRTNQLIKALTYCSCGFYDDSTFDCAFDNPIGYQGYPDSSLSIKDITNSSNVNYQGVSNDPSVGNSPNASNKPSNGTPFVTGFGTASSNSIYGVLTQYVIDSLQILNNYVQRHRLAGGRLLNRFLASRGLKLSNDVTETPYYLGQKDAEIEIDAVFNNSNTNLGEMAGRGVSAIDKDDPLSFDVTAEDDGIFFVVVFAKPDCDLPVYNDPWNARVSASDFYHGEFDKLGPVNVPRSIVYMTNNAYINKSSLVSGQFGFLNRYYDDVIERPRLLGDFRLTTRGANVLKSYFTFRDIAPMIAAGTTPAHSLEWLSGDIDYMQYNRLFYSDKVDNLMMFIRWRGKSYQEKLPLGDSYDWDDDEFNKKVTVLANGQQA